jgi:hypothetical protein
MLSSPPVLKLDMGTQGYLWLPFDLARLIKLIGVALKQKRFFFQTNILGHSGILSSFPEYCHSFRIIVIPFELLSFLPNIVIPFELF